MKQLFIILSLGLLLISCMKQTDLETLKYNKKIEIPLDELDKSDNGNVPVGNIYVVKNINNFKYNAFLLKNESIEFFNELLINKNELSLIVDSYETNNYLGFELNLIDEKTGDLFLNFLKKKYKNPIKKYNYSEGNYKDQDYLWESKKTNEIIKFSKHNESNHLNLKTKKEEVLSLTKIIILKDKLKAKVDLNDKRNDSENIKKILKENPNAFDVLEIYKSNFENN